MSAIGLGNTKEGVKEDFRELRGEAHDVKVEAKEKFIKPMAVPAFSDLGKAANDVRSPSCAMGDAGVGYSADTMVL